MPLNTALKVAIIQSGKKQKQIARRVRMSESVFSRKVHGGLPWSEEERERVAKILDKPESEIFPDVQSEAVAS